MTRQHRIHTTLEEIITALQEAGSDDRRVVAVVQHLLQEGYLRRARAPRRPRHLVQAA